MGTRKPGGILRKEGMMPTGNLVDAIQSLTPDDQESVREFIEFLRRKGSSPSSSFLAAAGEFIEEHPELLRRLAQ